jgi:hypothetical protein
MNDKPVSLAERRAQLVELCALQRDFLAQECEALRPQALGGGMLSQLATHKTAVLAAAGVALGLVITRPAKLLKFAAAGASVWKLARKVLPMLGRPSGA